MFEFIANNQSFFIFIVILSVFLYLKRKNLQLSGSFPFLYMLMYRTRLGLDRMQKWSTNHPKTFLNLSYLSIFIGVVGMVLTFIFMFWQLGFIIDNQITAGGGLVLPLKTEGGLESPVPVFYVPFWYWIVALFILATVHEFAHGVIAERFKIKIKSSGFAFMGIFAPILPAAFVEPDEKDLAKKPRWQQIAVFGAGSTSNFIFGFLFFAVWLFIAVPFVNDTIAIDTMSFSSVLNESDLISYNVTSGQILSVNGISDKEQILKEFANLSTQKPIEITINESGNINTYKITPYNDNQSQKTMIGIAGLHYTQTNKQGYEWLGNFPIYLQQLLFWIWFLNIGIGMMNLLPIWITDGGQIAKSILSKYFKENKAVFIYNIISITCLILIIFTLYPKLLLNFF